MNIFLDELLAECGTWPKTVRFWFISDHDPLPGIFNRILYLLLRFFYSAKNKA